MKRRFACPGRADFGMKSIGLNMFHKRLLLIVMKSPAENRKQRKKSTPHHAPSGSRSETGPGIHNGTMLHRLLERFGFTALVFVAALFFILTVSNPALYLNDEWISANQLHQIDSGHQVITNEFKYGATANGTISQYFIARSNILLYPLALPVISVPSLGLFGIFSDNFRLVVILIWSLIPVITAFLIEAICPRFGRIRGVRLAVLGILVGTVLFCINLFLYKQFPYSAPDAPFEVAALVFTNHLLFALIAAMVYETGRLLFKERALSLLATFSCIACSSCIFWAGTAKDHILTTAVFTGLILFWIRFLYYGQWRDAVIAFILSGFLFWVRPEVGLVVFCGLLLFLAGLTVSDLKKKTVSLKQALLSCTAPVGALIGAVPFFINNYILTGSAFVPVWIAPRSGAPIASTTQQLAGVAESVAINTTTASHYLTTIPSVFSAILSRFPPVSPETAVHFFNIAAFPAQGSIGFLILCPILPVAIVAAFLWGPEILRLPETDKKVMVCLLLMIGAIICSYLPEMAIMDVDKGIVPDIRYLVPLYIPAGLVSMMILRQTPVLTRPARLLKEAVYGSLALVPFFFILMILLNPFASEVNLYTLFFKYLIVFGIAAACLCMGIVRIWGGTPTGIRDSLPHLIILLVIAVLTLQVLLTLVYGVIIKFNGYPLWIPMVREGYALIFQVPYRLPI